MPCAIATLNGFTGCWGTKAIPFEIRGHDSLGAAEQLKTKSVWQLLCEHLLSTVASFKPKILRSLSPPTPVNCCF